MFWLVNKGPQVGTYGKTCEDWFGEDARVELDLINYILLLVSEAWTSFLTFSRSLAKSYLSFLVFSKSRSILDMAGFFGIFWDSLIWIPTTFFFNLS